MTLTLRDQTPIVYSTGINYMLPNIKGDTCSVPFSGTNNGGSNVSSYPNGIPNSSLSSCCSACNSDLE